MKKALNKLILRFFTKSLRAVKSGSINVVVNGVEFADTSFNEGSINVNLIDIAPLKGLRKIIKLPLDVKALLSSFSKLRDIAETLKNEKISFTVSWKGKELFILGEGAKPKIKHLLRTDAIEIKNIKDVLLLIKELA